MRVLLVGLGRWGEKHLRVLGELGVELWVADVSAERLALAVKAGVAAARAVPTTIWPWPGSVSARVAIASSRSR